MKCVNLNKKVWHENYVIPIIETQEKGLDKNATSHRLGEGIPNLYNQQYMYIQNVF